MIVVDIEGDGLLDTITKIHCMSWWDSETGIISSTINYDEMVEVLEKADIIAGHNFIRFDREAIKKIIGYEIPLEKLIDTLGLCWYLYPERKKNGLEVWGEEFGVPKPKIDDWSNLTSEQYIHRCEEDVKINLKLYNKLIEYLEKIYGKRTKKIISYISFKLDCAREQEEIGWKLDLDKVNRNIKYFEELRENKFKRLQEAMPKSLTYKTVSRPKDLYKKNGDLSVAGERWVNLLAEYELPLDYEADIQVLEKEEVGNPNSINKQLKSWLFSLGWIPKYFVESKNVDGLVNSVPQISDANKNICSSIKDLYSVEPELENLESLSIINHRLSILKGFLSNQKEGRIIAGMAGFTNTMRLKHSTIKITVVIK